MKPRAIVLVILAGLCLSLWVGVGCSQPPAPVAQEIQLPQPKLTGSMSVEGALAKRRSVRQFADRDLTLEQFGQLAWAAQGITEPKRGLRTAPSAMAAYPLTVYLVRRDGTFRYLPQGHKLVQVASGDLRATLAGQPAVQTAPLDIVITGNIAKLQGRSGPRAERFLALEAGHVAQNVALQATALGLGALTVGGYDDQQVSQALHLPAGETPLYILPVGYSK